VPKKLLGVLIGVVCQPVYQTSHVTKCTKCTKTHQGRCLVCKTNVTSITVPIVTGVPNAPVLQMDFKTYEARGLGGRSVHKEAHLPFTFPFKNCFEGVHSLNVDILLLQPIPSVDDPLREEKASHIKVASGLLDLCCMTSCWLINWLQRNGHMV